MVVGRAWVSIKVGLNVIIFKEHVIGASRLRLRLRSFVQLFRRGGDVVGGGAALAVPRIGINTLIIEDLRYNYGHSFDRGNIKFFNAGGFDLRKSVSFFGK